MIFGWIHHAPHSQPQIHPKSRKREGGSVEESDIADCRQVISALKQEDVQRSIRIRIVLMIALGKCIRQVLGEGCDEVHALEVLRCDTGLSRR